MNRKKNYKIFAIIFIALFFAVLFFIVVINSNADDDVPEFRWERFHRDQFYKGQFEKENFYEPPKAELENPSSDSSMPAELKSNPASVEDIMKSFDTGLLPEDKRRIILDWQPTSLADGYKIYVTTYYSKNKELFTEQIYDVGKVKKTTLAIKKLEGTSIVNICYQISAYTQHSTELVESKRSSEVCEKPWPPTGVHVK